MLSKEVLKDIHRDAINAAALCWGGTLARPDPVGQTENLVYACHPGFALRLVFADHRSVEAVQAELEWIQHLRNHQLPVVEVLPSPHHQLWEFFTFKKKHLFYGTAFRWIEGERFDAVHNPQFWSTQRLQQLGKLCAQLHANARNLSPQLQKRIQHRPGPFPPYLETLSQHWPESITDLKPAFLACYQNLQARWSAEHKNPERCGLIHGDLHAGNLIAQNQRLIAFDFDDCHHGWWTQDLAVIFYYLTRNFSAVGEVFSAQHREQVLSAYTEVLPLPPDFESDLELFLQWRQWLLLCFLWARFEQVEAFPADAQTAYARMVQQLRETC